MKTFHFLILAILLSLSYEAIKEEDIPKLGREKVMNLLGVKPEIAHELAKYPKLNKAIGAGWDQPWVSDEPLDYSN